VLGAIAGDIIGSVHAYPGRGYGGRFLTWAATREREPYSNWGNGSAMRVPAVGFAFDSIEDVRAAARRSAQVTHNHPEGIKGAEATAVAIFLARTGTRKDEIRATIAGLIAFHRVHRLRRRGAEGDLARR